MIFCLASSLDAESRYGLISMAGIVLVIVMMLLVQTGLAMLTMALAYSMVPRQVMKLVTVVDMEVKG